VLLQELQAKQTSQQNMSIDLPADVLFDFGKVNLRNDATPSIVKPAQLLQGHLRAPVTVRGHTDGKDSDDYSDALSLRRASAVATALQQHGAHITHVAGLGKRDPIASNTLPDGRDNPEGRQRNRRVQILIGLLHFDVALIIR